MTKITIIMISLSALLLSGYIKKTPSLHLSVYSGSANPSAVKAVADTTKLKVGDKCPDIIFRDTTGYEGKDVKLSQFKGKYVLIDVWASWCAPCRVQYPHFVALSKKMKDKAITFLSISIDNQVWRWKGIALNQMGGIQWKIRNETFEKAFGINTIPRYILIDKKGVILSLNMTMPSHAELEQELLKLKGI
jgi:thiol-disulfide isomerase/thioredoxin